MLANCGTSGSGGFSLLLPANHFQAFLQPASALHRRAAATFHKIGFPARTAGRCTQFDELLGAADGVPAAQVIELSRQMRARLGAGMPSAIAVELATRRRKRGKQRVDLGAHGWRHGSGGCEAILHYVIVFKAFTRKLKSSLFFW